jgi:hypothetical protein
VLAPKYLGRGNVHSLYSVGQGSHSRCRCNHGWWPVRPARLWLGGKMPSKKSTKGAKRSAKAMEDNDDGEGNEANEDNANKVVLLFIQFLNAFTADNVVRDRFTTFCLCQGMQHLQK